jgi:nicotinamide mononucleotide transporter
MSPLEIIAVLLGIANILLLIRRSIWNYPAGIAMVTLYAWIFFHAHLYSDTLLQLFFFIVQIVGWVAWSKNAAGDGEIVVLRSSPRDLIQFIAGTGVGVILLGGAMARWTPASYPYWDATVASMSVAAQLLLTWRRLENWLWWIAADVIAIGVYTAKALYLTAGLYGLFLVMAIIGYQSWRKTHRRQILQPSPL